MIAIEGRWIRDAMRIADDIRQSKTPHAVHIPPGMPDHLREGLLECVEIAKTHNAEDKARKRNVLQADGVYPAAPGSGP